MLRANTNFIYEGIHDTLNCKALFMEQAMALKPIMDDVVEYLIKDEELRSKLGMQSTKIKGGIIGTIDMYEEQLEVLFDTFLVNGLIKNFDELSEEDKYYASSMMENAKTIEIDITHYIVYAIVMNDMCRKKLEGIQECNEYLNYWETSKYVDIRFEEFVPAEYVWDMRLLVGIIEKLRQEPYREHTYKLFMEIIYTGFSYLKRKIKGAHFISSNTIRDVLKTERNNMFPIKCNLFLLFVIADDMNIPVMWDYDMVAFMQSCGSFYDEYDMKVDMKNDILPKDQGDFLKQFEEKYGTYQSLLEFAVGENAKEIGTLIFKIMNIFHVCPRKFTMCELSKDECARILKLRDKWNQKNYGYMLIIAHLTKYIQHLEHKYLEMEKEVQYRLHTKKKEDESQKNSLLQQKQNDLDRMSAEKKQLAESLLKQEQQIQKLQEKLEISEKQLQEQTQELSALRSYVYLMKDEEDESELSSSADQDVIINLLKDKKVLVIGGHFNWHNKLKELFPKWQFLRSEQCALIGNVIKGCEMIICNTAMLAHTCYYKLLAEKSKSQKLYYVHSYNISKCMMELKKQME